MKNVLFRRRSLALLVPLDFVPASQAVLEEPEEILLRIADMFATAKEVGRVLDSRIEEALALLS